MFTKLIKSRKNRINRKMFLENLEERTVLTTSAVGSFAGQMVNDASNLMLSAKADFFIDDNNTTNTTDDKLVVHLTNVGPGGANVPSDILTGVYFDVEDNPSLSPVSASVPKGSYILNRTDLSQPTNVGGEWDFRGNGGWTPKIGGVFNPEFAFSQRYGISAAGLSIFGHGSFNGPDLNPPSKPNGSIDTTKPIQGMDYGIISKVGAKPNNGMIDEPLIVNEVVFTLNGYNGGMISNVSFQYGTAANEPRINVVSVADSPIVNLIAQSTEEGPTSSYIFTATMSMPSVGTTTVHTSVGDIIVTNGNTVGTLTISANNDEDVYTDPTSLYAKILSVDNSENVVVLIGDPSDAISYILDTIDDTFLDLSGSVAFEGGDAKYVFTATLTNPAGTDVTVKTNVGDIFIKAGESTGSLAINANNGEDFYKDYSNKLAVVDTIFGGNFENLIFGTASAMAEVLDTVDTTFVNLQGFAYYADGGFYSLKVTLTNPSRGDTTIVLSNGSVITIPDGESVGTIDFKSTLLNVKIESVDGGDFEKVVFSGQVNAPINSTILSGKSFKDLDNDGIRDNIEPGMAGEKITITYTSWTAGEVTIEVTTDINGNYLFVASDAVIGKTCVIMPESASNGETQTMGAEGYSFIVEESTDDVKADFGYHSNNVKQNGLTIGFWSNKNGAAFISSNGVSLKDEVRTLLNGLNLRNADGSRLMLGGNDLKMFQNWLRAANAKNMANMLSAQLAGTVLNVYKTFVNSGLYIDFNAVTTAGSSIKLSEAMIEQLNLHNLGDKDCQFAKVSDIINAAAVELNVHTVTIVAGDNRVYQEALKNIFDAINNNQEIFNG